MFRDVEGEYQPTWLDAVEASGKVTIREPETYLEYTSWWRDPRSRQAAKSLLNGIAASRPTIAEKVFALSSPMTPRVQALMDRKPGKEKRPLGLLAAKGLDALAFSLGVNFDPGKRYITSFSAGYDTRVLFSLMRDFDLSNVTLVTWEPEIVESIEVYEALGLSCLHPCFAGGEDYWLPIFRDTTRLAKYMGDPGRRTGGAGWLHRAGADAGCLFSALWADEVFAWAKFGTMNVAEFTAGRMLENSAPWPGLWPFASVPWIEFLCRYSLGGFKPEFADHGYRKKYSRADTLKREMIRQFDPKLLEIPNPRFRIATRMRDGEELPHQCLSEGARDELQELHFRNERPPRYLGDGYGGWVRSYQFGVMLQAASKVAEVTFEASEPGGVA